MFACVCVLNAELGVMTLSLGINIHFTILHMCYKAKLTFSHMFLGYYGDKSQLQCTDYRWVSSNFLIYLSESN